MITHSTLINYEHAIYTVKMNDLDKNKSSDFGDDVMTFL